MNYIKRLYNRIRIKSTIGQISKQYNSLVDTSSISTSYNEDMYTDFEVKGAGKIILGNYNKSQCGGIEGFSIGVQWGRYGYTGGVISNEEAIKLARHILRTNNLNNLLGE